MLVLAPFQLEDEESEQAVQYIIKLNVSSNLFSVLHRVTPVFSLHSTVIANSQWTQSQAVTSVSTFNLKSTTKDNIVVVPSNSSAQKLRTSKHGRPLRHSIEHLARVLCLLRPRNIGPEAEGGDVRYVWLVIKGFHAKG